MKNTIQQPCPVWVLNLERSTGRRRFMEQQLQHYQLEYEIIQAIDGRNLTHDELQAYSKPAAIRSCGRELSPGEIGCALSHALIWQRIVDENLNDVLVLEDDVIVEHALLKLLQHRHAFPQDWELINFLTDAHPIPPFGSPVYDEYRFCHLKRYANGCCAYLLNRQGAQKLMEHVYPIRRAADGLTGRTYITGMVSYGITPQVAKLAEFTSDIWNGAKEPPHRFFRNIKMSVEDEVRHLVDCYRRGRL